MDGVKLVLAALLGEASSEWIIAIPRWQKRMDGVKLVLAALLGEASSECLTLTFPLSKTLSPSHSTTASQERRPSDLESASSAPEHMQAGGRPITLDMPQSELVNRFGLHIAHARKTVISTGAR
ncbi:hypothetical protein C8R46DRAFT_1320568 [Mycena filopes]|nr:hypothetical protein C8R46DRAFT_1320568 [Mycena filopes]